MTRGLLFGHRVVDPVQTMTGIGRYTTQLICALAAIGEPNGLTYELVAPGERGEPAWLPPSVSYRRVPVPRRALHLAWLLARAPTLERLVGEGDVLHVLHPTFPIPTKLPTVITVHDVLPLDHPDWYRPLERYGFRRSLELAGRSQWRVIADSQYVAGKLEAHGISPSRVSVVPLGVGEEFRRPVERTQLDASCATVGVAPGRFILAVGNVSTRKNLVMLVKAMADVEPRDVPLVLAGRPHTSAGHVEAAINHAGLGNRVRMAGYVDDELLTALIQAAHLVVHPSIEEGFGLPPLEAMAAGVPVVAARAGSLPEIVGDAGLLVDPHGADEWAAAITRVITDDALRRQLIAAGRTRAKAFTWEAAAARTLAVHRAAADE